MIKIDLVFTTTITEIKTQQKTKTTKNVDVK
jgi:hypothetical protein